MKEQLPQYLLFFYVIPAVVSVLVFCISFLLVLTTASDTSSPFFIIPMVLFMASFIAMIGKSTADARMKKIRNGINPQYLLRKYPGNLEAQVNDLLQQKYEVKEKSGSTAHLEKKPYFSILLFLLFLLLGFIPGVLYLVWYFLQPKEVVLLDISTQK